MKSTEDLIAEFDAQLQTTTSENLPMQELLGLDKCSGAFEAHSELKSEEG